MSGCFGFKIFIVCVLPVFSALLIPVCVLAVFSALLIPVFFHVYGINHLQKLRQIKHVLYVFTHYHT